MRRLATTALALLAASIGTHVQTATSLVTNPGFADGPFCGASLHGASLHGPGPTGVGTTWRRWRRC